MRFNNLNEDCQKHECECENCGNYPLKHFEKCPKCFSESFHKVIFKEGEKEKDEETRNR